MIDISTITLAPSQDAIIFAEHNTKLIKHNAGLKILGLFLAGFGLAGIIAIYQYKIRKPNENDRKF